MTRKTLDEEARAFTAWVTTPPRCDPPRMAPSLAAATREDVDTPAGRVATWRLGQGPAVLLVHGWSNDNACWETLIGELKARGRAVAVLDLPGHGLSGDAHCTRRSAGEAVLRVAEKLGPLDAAVGHSFGAPAVAVALSRGLELDRVAFLAPPTARSARWLVAARDKGVAPEIAERALAVAESEGEAFDMSQPGPHMRAKALFVHSREDATTPYASTQAISAAWSGSELVLVDGLSHAGTADDPEVCRRVAEFLTA